MTVFFLFYKNAFELFLYILALYGHQSEQKLFKLLGVDEPLQKVAPVLIVELQTLYTVRSGSGMSDLKQQAQVGLARLWAVKVNVDERHSILWQLEVI